ncbi:hypothetical protein SAMN05421693_1262 [Ectothiorhodospira magna]|uniref:Uncharacterized protein n=1 Tax=Ectothiorhodospira magna TaxID=867345 RepID=A0A1H9FEY1_9GAMM|nr:hypothetical protein SAMN05421693_1262 [Ectothiorhodospira magna]
MLDLSRENGMSESIQRNEVNYPRLKSGACLPAASQVRASQVDQPEQDARKGLRLQQVVKTHRQMLPQSAALEGWDHAGER